MPAGERKTQIITLIKRTAACWRRLKKKPNYKGEMGIKWIADNPIRSQTERSDRCTQLWLRYSQKAPKPDWIPVSPWPPCTTWARRGSLCAIHAAGSCNAPGLLRWCLGNAASLPTPFPRCFPDSYPTSANLRQSDHFLSPICFLNHLPPKLFLLLLLLLFNF